MQPLAFVAKVKRSLMRKTCSRSCDLRSNGSAQCETGWASLRRDPDAAAWPVQTACLLRTGVAAFPKILIRNLLLVNASLTYAGSIDSGQKCKKKSNESQTCSDSHCRVTLEHAQPSAGICRVTPSWSTAVWSWLRMIPNPISEFL